ncbi:MAG: glycosyl hydrolase [bacterium]|nr:MAG: glycosyl hydrolase [bacterium]
MKKITFLKRGLLLVFLLAGFIQISQAQEWRHNLPQNKQKNHTLTLKDYQKAFAKYWSKGRMKEAPKGENKVRDENYEKFKRWEWYWETRVTPGTEAFPQKNAWDVFKQYMANLPKEIQAQDKGNWVSDGPNQTTGGYAGLGRVNSVAFSPVDTNTLYVGTASGGVWKTSDLGGHWTPLGDFNMSLGVADIVVENNGGDDIVYLGTGDKDHWDTYSIGVLKSIDGGQTWKKTGLDWNQNYYGMVYRILKDPGNDNTLYVSTNKGLFKTTDGGDTFNRIDAHHFRDIKFQPGSNTVMYGGDSWGGIFYSTDAGDSWTQVVDKSGVNAGRVAIAVSADSSNVVYGLIVASDNGLFGVYRSRDYGHTFKVVQDTINLLGWNCSGNDTGGQGWYDLVLAADPHNAEKIYVGGVNNWTSADGGKSWTLANHWSSTCGGKNDIVHADKHYMAFQPGTNALFEGNDGGIYKSKEGKHWTDLTSGMAISQIYRMSISATVSDEVITGLQDNGTKLLFSGKWNNVMGGDGMDCQIDYTDAKVQYGESPNGDIVRTKDQWQNSKDISSGITGTGAWVTPFLLDPKKHKTLYIGYQDVFKSTDQGDKWTKLTSWGGKTLRSLAVAPSNPQYIYAATYSILYRTTDGGQTWKDITGSLPVNYASITNITVKNDNPGKVWITMGGFNNLGVFETRNGGGSWENISTGLPEIPVNYIVQNTLKKDTTELYAGTDLGVYVQQGRSRWIPFMGHLPNVIVNDLEIQYDNQGSGKLYAATFGRGLWSSPLFTGHIPQIKQADFEADNVNPFIGDTVSFTDLSTDKPIAWKWVFTPGTVTYLVGSDTSQNPKVSFNVVGSYTVKLTAYDADSSYTRTEQNYIQVRSPLSVKVVANRTTVCSGDTTQLFAIASGGSGNNVFNWGSIPFGFYSSVQNPIVKPGADSIVYSVSVYAGNLVANGSIKIYREECTGIHDNEALLGKVNIFPNPNSGNFVIKAQKNIYRIEIISQNGAKVFSKVYNSNSVTVNKTLANGIYFVEIYVGSKSDIKGMITRKLVVR